MHELESDSYYHVFIQSTVPFPPPTDAYVVDLSLRQVVFKWSSVSSTCHQIRYNIISNNCGQCPDITTHTTATCTGIPTNDQQCTFALQTIVCNNLIGNTSKEIQIVLRGKTLSLSSDSYIAPCSYIRYVVITNSYWIIYCMYYPSVPNPPVVDLIPVYSYDTKDLIGLKTIFSEDLVVSLKNSNQ